MVGEKLSALEHQRRSNKCCAVGGGAKEGFSEVTSQFSRGLPGEKKGRAFKTGTKGVYWGWGGFGGQSGRKSRVQRALFVVSLFLCDGASEMFRLVRDRFTFDF